MSCMIMSKEPLAALANATEALLNCGYDYFGFDPPDSLLAAARDCRNMGFFSADALYRRMYALNVAAYNGRYADHEQPMTDETPDVDLSKYRVHCPPEYAEHHHAVRPWHYQLAKLLDFWIYQVTEDATRNDAFVLAMRECRDHLFQFIVQRSAEYDRYEWGRL